MPKIEPFENHLNRYEEWFERNKFIYLSELNAVRNLIPEDGFGVEIGVGTGRFAAPLGIKIGIEPSAKVGKIARRRGIEVLEGVAEELSLRHSSFDYALMVTTICFLDDIEKAFKEVHRILRPNGRFIIGFIDIESPIGREYLRRKDRSVFYKIATFYSVEEVIRYLRGAGFHEFEFVQTIFSKLGDIKKVEPVKKGHGEASFIVISAKKTT